MLRPLLDHHARRSAAGLTGHVRFGSTAWAIVQADWVMALGGLADTDPARVHPTADILDVVTAMADYNLLTPPVVDTDQHLIGLITVDDVLEAAVPTNWGRREPGQKPSAPASA